MAAVSTIVAAAALAVSAAGVYSSVQQQKKAQQNADRAAEEQAKAQQEQSNANASAAASERRKQIREERIRRAQILQSASNTGVSGSSGEFGALSSLSTQLTSNLGQNAGAVARGQRISTFNQNAANFMGAARRNQSNAGVANQISGLGTSIFSGVGGFGAFMKPTTPSTGTTVGTFADYGLSYAQ